MESEDKFHECKKSCNCGSGETLRQTLGELDFERGIWSAAQSNDLSRLNTLLNKGIPPDLEDASGYTALHYASRNGHLRVCEKLLGKGANANATTRSGRTTPLHRAATQGHTEIVRLLLDYGANPNIQEADGYTALHRAILAEKDDVAKVLQPLTDPTLVDKTNKTWRDLARDKRKHQLLT